jgi:hypothetical protein
MARPIGSKNQKTIDWDTFGRDLIDGGLPRLKSILTECDDDTFIKVYIPLLEYFKPKLKRLEQTTPVEKQVIEVRWDEPSIIYGTPHEPK